MSLPKKYKIDATASYNHGIFVASKNGDLDMLRLLSIHYLDKFPMYVLHYEQDINNYILEFNKNPIEMNRKMRLHYLNNDLKYYSLTILFNDEYLILEDNSNKDVKEFFDITKKLNNDILMLSINILINQNKIVISSNNFNFFLSEPQCSTLK